MCLFPRPHNQILIDNQRITHKATRPRWPAAERSNAAYWRGMWEHGSDGVHAVWFRACGVPAPHQSPTPVPHTSPPHQSPTPVSNTSQPHQSATPVSHTSQPHQSASCSPLSDLSVRPFWGLPLWDSPWTSIPVPTHTPLEAIHAIGPPTPPSSARSSHRTKLPRARPCPHQPFSPSALVPISHSPSHLASLSPRLTH